MRAVVLFAKVAIKVVNGLSHDIENEGVLPSFSHFFLKPLFLRSPTIEALSITTKIPLACNLVLAPRKFLKTLIVHQHMLSSAEFAMANLLSALLRLTAAKCACWKSFSTFTHITCNVVSGRKLSLRHSVKHYEAISLNCLKRCRSSSRSRYK